MNRVKASDAGQYTCILSSSDGSTQIAVVNLRVRDDSQPQVIPPTARLTEKEKSVTVGESFQLTCLTSGYPQPSTVWYFNNQQIEKTQNVYVSGNMLTVREANLNQNGYFTCRALTQDGRYAEDSASVRVNPQEEEKEDESFTVDILPRSMISNVGESTRLVCNVLDAEGNSYSDQRSLRFTWNKENGYLPSGSYADTDSLTLYNLQVQDSGLYTCDVENIENGLKSQASSTLIVQGDQNQPERPTEVESEPLTVQVSPKEAYLIQGRTAEFYCTVKGGRGSPIATWKKTGDLLDASRHIIDGLKLTIRNVMPSDRGYFECEAESGTEYSRDYTLVDVEQRELPQIEIYPSQEQIDLDYGGTTYLQCRVISGIPSPKVEWSRADRRQLSRGVSVEQDGSLLQISNADVDEFGSYECVARNEEGEARSRVLVVPRGSPVTERPTQQPEPQVEENNAPNVLLNEKTVEAREGEAVTLNCKTSVNGPVRFDWYGPDESYIGGELDGSLVLSNLKPSQSGYYSCEVTNTFGNAREKLFLDVIANEPSPLRVEVRPKSKTVLDGGRAEFTCNVATANGEPVDDSLIRWSRASKAELSRFHSIRGNVLTLYNINEDDAGRYICTVQASFGRIEFDVAYLQISKNDLSSAFPIYIRVLEAPTESSNQQSAAFRYGIKVTAECVAQADDVEEVTWSKSEGVDRANYNRNGNTNTLEIPALVPMDLGTYVCIAIRRNGEKAQNSIVFSRIADQGSQFTYEVRGPTEPVSIQPTVTEGPETTVTELVQLSNDEQPTALIVGSKQLSVSEGGSITIECQVTGTFDSEMAKHGESLPVGHRIEKNGRNHKLTLFNLEQKDSGYYVCNVNNAYGSNRDYIYLEVTRSDSQDSNDNEELDGYERERLQREREQQEREQQEREERERYEQEREQREREEQARNEEDGQQQETEEERDQREREQREREQLERAERLRQEEKEAEERENEPEAQPESQHQHKPLVYIKALTNGAPILAGKSLRIACLINDLDAQVSFVKNDGSNDERMESRIQSNEKEIVHELVFSSFSAEDVGSYRCYARNRYGETEDSAIIELEADGSFSFRTEKSEGEVVPGNPKVNIGVRGLLRENSFVELNCSLEDDNGIPAKSHSWARYPSLPRSSQIEENRLVIMQFDNNEDNGLYTCGVSTDEKDYEKTKLIASDDYLLAPNPFFRFSKNEEEDAIEVKCRPGE